MRRLAILAENAFSWQTAKTATGVIRYGNDLVVAVIDSTQAGKDVAQALQLSYGAGIPIVHDIYAALDYQPDALMIGIAPTRGELPEVWRGVLLAAIDAGLDIISGLHTFLSDDVELSSAAARRGVTLWDVRRPPDKKLVARYLPHRPGSHTILTVGSDCVAGKMTSALELNLAAQRHGINSGFLATGQTGIMISGNGLPADRIISDFLAGLVEELVLDFTNQYDWVFVEGQGALNHPGYSPVTLGLLHGSMPDAMIFSHRANATTLSSYENCPILPLKRLIEMNEAVVSWPNPQRQARVVGISLITAGMNDQEAQDVIKQVEDETGLPTTDTFRFGADMLIDALLTHFAA
ncbi:MAG: DUF1611 domain-containing protein [Ktedonobacteraceae bacterium]|nr:DUF1611 domain-containing protein [Ktedonobacteraceae bacterium]